MNQASGFFQEEMRSRTFSVGLCSFWLVLALLSASCGGSGGGGGNLLPPTPVVTTGSVVINSTQATLHGQVNTQGLDGEAWFEWGEDSTMASFTRIDSDNTVTRALGNQPVSAVIPDLICGKTYYYRVVAENSSSQRTEGDIQSFMICAGVPTATTTSAAKLSETSATLNGQVNPNWLDTTVWFEWGASSALNGPPSSNFSLAAEMGDQPVSALISGLTCGEVYYFRVMAENSSGPAAGNINSFIFCAAAPTATPTSVTNLSGNGVRLTGEVNPNWVDTQVWFEWGTDSTLGEPRIGNTSLGAVGTGQPVSAEIAGLACGTTYYYRMVAENTSGRMEGDIQSFMICAGAPTATTMSAAKLSETSATLNGKVNSNWLVTTAWFKWGADSTLSGSPTSISSLGAGGTEQPVSATISGLVCGTTYYYQMVANNASGQAGGDIRDFIFCAAVPAVITNSATNLSETSVTLNGQVNPNWLGSITSFIWGTDSTLDSTLGSTTVQTIPVGGSVNVAADLAGLTPGTTYYFRIVAQNAEGESLGNIRSFNTVAVVPVVADAGENKAAYTGDNVVLSGSSSTGPITSWSWVQMDGPVVSLNDSNTATPWFIAPDTDSDIVLRFQLTVTDDVFGGAHVDEVEVTIHRKATALFIDTFDENSFTNGTYQLGGSGSNRYSYDAVTGRMQITLSGQQNLTFSSNLDNNLVATSGVFSIDFRPTGNTTNYGGIRISLLQSDGSAFVVQNFNPANQAPANAAVEKRTSGNILEVEERFTAGYTYNTEYHLEIAFDPTGVTFNGFGQTVTLSTPLLGITGFQVELIRHTGYVDNVGVFESP